MAGVDNTSESRTSSPVHRSPISDHDPNSLEDDRQLNLSLRARCTIPFKVKKTDTLKKLKQACHDEEGVSKKLLDCFFDQYYLKDEHTYDNAIAILATRIIVKVPSLKSNLNTTIIGKINDTVGLIKCKAVHKLHLESHGYDVMFNGAYLESDEILGSFHIPNDSIFYLVKRPVEVLPIVVITPKKKPIVFHVKKMHTILDAKTIAGSMFNLDVEKAVLMMDGCPTLDESRTFHSYNFRDKSTFKLVFQFEVFVAVIGGPKVSVTVLPCDRVDDLNKKATKVLKWTQRNYPFFYHDIKLENQHNIAHYGISKGCTLLMGTRWYI